MTAPPQIADLSSSNSSVVSSPSIPLGEGAQFNFHLCGLRFSPPRDPLHVEIMEIDLPLSLGYTKYSPSPPGVDV